MNNPEFTINGHPLPTALVEALGSGRWRLPADPGRLVAVFAHQPNHPSFYGLEQMRRENAGWLRETYLGYFGSADSQRPPGDLHPQHSVLIGDLGPDVPFALDYRTAPVPRVVFLTDEDEHSRWVQVASSIDELIASLGL
jgi:hypothetical protein